MKKVEEMSTEQIISWLNKTRKSIHTYNTKSSGSSTTQRAFELIDRFTELKEAAEEKGIWIDYCTTTGIYYKSDAYDLFA
jgi:hypothetical protein